VITATDDQSDAFRNAQAGGCTLRAVGAVEGIGQFKLDAERFRRLERDGLVSRQRTITRPALTWQDGAIRDKGYKAEVLEATADVLLVFDAGNERMPLLLRKVLPDQTALDNRRQIVTE